MTLHLSDIGFRYPGAAAPTLSDIDLAVAPGECVALMGASGCGKSTLFGIVAGFLRPDTGRVMLDGRDVTGLPPERRGLGLVPQQYALFPTRNARDNVAYPLRLRGVARRDAAAMAQDALAAVGLGEMADRFPDALSGGQRQRVALARATVFAPPALLLDEPLSALDPHLRRELRAELRRVQRATGAACLIVTHDADEAFALADRVAVMEAGRIAQLDTPACVHAAPATLATARFTGPVHRLPGTVGPDGAIETPWGRLPPAAPRPAPVPPGRIALVRPEGLARRPAGAASLPGELVLSVVAIDSRRQGGAFVHEVVAAGETFQLVDGDPRPPDSIAVRASSVMLVPGA
ncbi:ABC transporter ATP-binding protein [Sphingomonas hankookensis]|uniref:ABC transporter ATP-binding protein n=1 Tax=Sphingomonas hengshuiensis TaxID=1609977 RepID=A0A2W4ZFT8_9SPHN|nr:MAG: ABC transporter ATP-binding protein [Sphingomonas hengshuiensis]